jgi:hypothetical protein
VSAETSKNKSVITRLLYRVQPRKTKNGNFVCAMTVRGKIRPRP